MITVAAILTAALPSGTNVLAGREALSRELSWATRPRPSPPAFAHLTGGELVLLSGPALANLDERMTLEAAVRQLAGLGVAAIAYVGRVSAGARAAADQTGVALLQLPAAADLGSLEREASHLITERRRDAQRRGQEAGRRLMELAIAGEPLAAIARAIAELSGRAVALEGRDGRILALHGDRTAGQPAIAPLLAATRAGLLDWLRGTATGSPAEPQTATLTLADGWCRVVAPVIGRDGLLGNLSLIVPGPAAAPEDDAITSRGAAACAVVMAREQATLVARREIELNVLDEVLDGALRSEVTLLQQAKRLGHDLLLPHVVLVARIDQNGPIGIARPREGRWEPLEEVMARRAPRLLWRVRHNNAEILWPVADAGEARGVAAALHDDLAERLGETGATVSLGVGQVRAGLAGIQRSHQEAKQALLMARRLDGNRGPTRFDDLGVYRLIFAAEGLEELRAFHDEALAPLIAYDRQHGADLIRTLKAFFDARCGPKEAAALLRVHRNTVLYRLDRVRDITGFDLDDADVRLRLHLALCVHLALFQAPD